MKPCNHCLQLNLNNTTCMQLDKTFPDWVFCLSSAAGAKSENLQTGCPISGHRKYTDHVFTLFLLKVGNVKQIISIIRAPVDLHYKEQHVQRGYEFHQHGGWSLTGAGHLTHTQWQPCFNPPAKGRSFKTDERQDMQQCLKFHVRIIDLGLFFHVLISPVNIWAERLWTEISLNMNKSSWVNVIWISAFHLLKCQSRSEGVIMGNWMMRPLLFQTNLLPGICQGAATIKFKETYHLLFCWLHAFGHQGVSVIKFRLEVVRPGSTRLRTTVIVFVCSVRMGSDECSKLFWTSHSFTQSHWELPSNKCTAVLLVTENWPINPLYGVWWL